MKVVFVPENLNVDELISKNPPPIDNFKKDKLLILLSQIAEYTLTVDDFDTWSGYASLQAKILQSIEHDYKRYFEYLEKTGVIEIHKSYLARVFTKGYKYTDPYQTPMQTLIIEDYKVKVREKTKKKDPVHEKYKVWKRKYLTKWLDPIYLQIDYEAALNFINENYKPLYPNKITTRTNFRAIRKYNSYFLSITKIHYEEFYITVDDKSRRLHSNLTSLKKELRQFISFKGKQLISLDISNSQPYLSIAILQESFYDCESKFNHNKIQLENTALIYAKNSAAATIMLEKARKTSNSLDEYRDMVIKGELYDYFVDIAKQLGLNFLKTRAQAKDMMFKVFFTKNTVLGQGTRPAKMKKVFKKLFPEVYELFTIIKRGHEQYIQLAILLQRIESYLVIETICKRIAKHNPDIPMYTIHDSIATTEEYLDIVHDIMMEVLKEYIGYAPTIKRESWS